MSDAAIVNAFGNHELLRYDYRAAEQGTEAFNASVLQAVNQHGFVVIENALPGETCDQLVNEMRPYIDATPHGLHGLGGTRRVGALAARSETSHQMIAHPAILHLAKSILAEQRLIGDAVRINGREATGQQGFRYPWQLHLTQIIDVGPGGGSEELPHQLKLHRANGMWVHDFQFTGIDPQMEVMWALTDFTSDNGATHVVLGSHREEPRGGPLGYSQPTVQAEMPKGSALVWTGWSVHGAGVNRSEQRRVGMNINYALGFLTQEENQLLACPPHIARELPDQMQRLLGYRQPAGSLNYVAECQSPVDSVLQSDFDVMIPGAHGHAMDPSIDGPGFAPLDEQEFRARVKEFETKKAKAIAEDDLELALQYKKSISVLHRSPRF
jgi:ectoine hydroxylase-related dioxygenase (phytanoyl-CoA dioxygenase family)